MMARVIARWVDDTLESPLAVDVLIADGRIAGPNMAFGCIDWEGAQRPFTLDEAGTIRFGPGGGESLIDFSARCIAIFTRLAEAHRGQTIAIAAHGGVLDCLYRAANGIGLQAPRTWQLANAAVNRVLYTGEGFRVVGWDDRRHFDSAEPDSGAAEEIAA